MNDNTHGGIPKLPSGSGGGQKVLIAPKLQGSLLKGGLGQSSGIGTSSILNLPVLGNDVNAIMPTNRGLKGVESSKALMRGEENKITSGSSSFAEQASINMPHN